jgi:hypothetical protein
VVCEPDARKARKALEALTVRAPKTVGAVALINVDRDRLPVRPRWVRARPEDESARTATYAHLLPAVLDRGNTDGASASGHGPETTSARADG